MVLLLSATTILGDSPKYFADDSLQGTLSSNNAPSQAFFFSGEHNRTYVAYMSDEFYAMVTYYDHDTKRWAEPVQVDDLRFNDGHNAPELLVTRNGYLHLFYGCHGDAVKYARSLYPEQITRWRLGKEIGSRATYPNPVQLANGDILLFYRFGGASINSPLKFHRSSDNGSTWDAGTEIIDFLRGACYIRGIKYDAKENMLYLELTERYRKPKPEEIPPGATIYEGDRFLPYAARYDLTTGHVIAINGVDMGTTATKDELDANGCQTGDYRFLQLPGVRVLEMPPPARREGRMYSADGVHIQGYAARDGSLMVWRSSDAGHTWDDGQLVLSANELGEPITGSVNIVTNYCGSGPLVIFQGNAENASPEFLLRYAARTKYNIRPILMPWKQRAWHIGWNHYNIPPRKGKRLYAVDAQGNLLY